MSGGNMPLETSARDVGGVTIVAGTDVQRMIPGLNVIGFSCSSNLTISVIAINPFDEGGVAHVTGPVRPSRQILNDVLNDVLPP